MKYALSPARRRHPRHWGRGLWLPVANHNAHSQVNGTTVLIYALRLLGCFEYKTWMPCFIISFNLCVWPREPFLVNERAPPLIWIRTLLRSSLNLVDPCLPMVPLLFRVFICFSKSSLYSHCVTRSFAHAGVRKSIVHCALPSGMSMKVTMLPSRSMAFVRGRALST